MAQDVARYERNLREELDGSALYAALAAAEVDPVRKDLFLQLSQAEAGHAQLWREKLSAVGVNAERFTPSFRTRVLARLAQRFGPRFVLPVIAAAEFADRNKYSGQADASALSSDERGHAAVIQAVATSRTGGMIGADIAKAEPWHRRATGNDLRAAVLGACRTRMAAVPLERPPDHRLARARRNTEPSLRLTDLTFSPERAPRGATRSRAAPLAGVPPPAGQ